MTFTYRHKYLLPAGLIISMLLLVIATWHYPGGSTADPASVGFYWAHNYFSNLLNPVAINGDANPARYWAVAAVFFLSLSMATFFYRFAQRIPYRGSARVVRWGGITAALAGMLVSIPSQHDIMVLISGVCTLLVFFYLMVLVMPSRHRWLKIASVVFLSLFYLTSGIYFSGYMLYLLPVLQKLMLLAQMVWAIWLDNAIEREDLLPRKATVS